MTVADHSKPTLLDYFQQREKKLCSPTQFLKQATSLGCMTELEGNLNLILSGATMARVSPCAFFLAINLEPSHCCQQ